MGGRLHRLRTCNGFFGFFVCEGMSGDHDMRRRGGRAIAIARKVRIHLRMHAAAPVLGALPGDQCPEQRPSDRPHQHKCKGPHMERRGVSCAIRGSTDR